tara:strand:- start:1321 stop:1455 length:135 start_codon:yes stop_codon:yes gene_type:complete
LQSDILGGFIILILKKENQVKEKKPMRRTSALKIVVSNRVFKID